ncbi:hypothetical protein DWV12_17645, partial [Clostridium botulinum]|nr:hypothetical protein [Clostridium botulinum]
HLSRTCTLAKRLKVNANQLKLVTSDIAWIISHNEVLFSHILPEIQASFKDLKQFLIEVS